MGPDYLREGFHFALCEVRFLAKIKRSHAISWDAKISGLLISHPLFVIDRQRRITLSQVAIEDLFRFSVTVKDVSALVAQYEPKIVNAIVPERHSDYWCGLVKPKANAINGGLWQSLHNDKTHT